MKNYNLSNLKWGVCDKSDRLIAAFDDQQAATQFHSTIKGTPQFSSQDLQVVNLSTGEPISQRETTGDRVGA